MAEPTSREECIERHREYSIDVSLRLNPLQRSRLAAMVSRVQPGDEVLDVGCNSGYMVDFVPPTCKVHGVDVSRELVARAKERLVTAQEASAEDLPFPAGAFDVVVLGEIIEHVHDPVHVLREAARVSRRLVVGSTPHEDGKWGPRGPRAPQGHRFHVRCYTEPQLRADLLAAGLTVIDIGTVSRDGEKQMYTWAAAV